MFLVLNDWISTSARQNSSISFWAWQMEASTRVDSLRSSANGRLRSASDAVARLQKWRAMRMFTLSWTQSGTSARSYDGGVNLTIELDREDDGRWIAEALELPGVMCYGQTRDEAISNAERLAIEVIADRIAHGEMASSALAVSFSIPDEQLASH